jgi:hypothetical protein
MLKAPSSRRARCAFSSARMRWITAFGALASISIVHTFDARVATAKEPIQIAFSEENIPAQDLPSAVPTPEAGPSEDWVVVPASASTVVAPAASEPSAAASSASSPAPGDTSAAQIEPTPMPSPTDIAPLEVGSVAPQSQISDASLDALIQSVSTTQPALAASLRVTDQAREEIVSHREGDAIQTLGRAISIDGSNPYAYFYLGRAYIARKNYPQAITFLNRAEARLATNPQWLGETLAFEGLADEQAGQNAPAIACYQKALAAVPGNLMARVGLTRLSADQAAQPAGATDASSDGGGSIPGPPPSQPPPSASSGE